MGPVCLSVCLLAISLQVHERGQLRLTWASSSSIIYHKNFSKCIQVGVLIDERIGNDSFPHTTITDRASLPARYFHSHAHKITKPTDRSYTSSIILRDQCKPRKLLVSLNILHPWFNDRHHGKVIAIQDSPTYFLRFSVSLTLSTADRPPCDCD